MKNYVEIDVTPKEYALIKLFIENPNKEFSRDELLDLVWVDSYFGDIHSIREAYISTNQRIAINLFKDNLAIYEIKDKMLKGALLANINIVNEQIVMSEWSTGGYLEK